MVTHDLPTRGTKRKSDSYEQLDDPRTTSKIEPGLAVDNDLKQVIQAQPEATNNDPARASHVKFEPTDNDNDSDSATLHDPSDETMNPHDLADLSYKLRILPVPEDGDSLEDTAQKLREMAQVVQAGDSLALFTGLQLSAPHGRGRSHDPEELARSQMTPQERMVYDAWRRMKRQKREHSSSAVGVNATSDENAPPSDMGTGTGSLPAFDWEANRAPLPGAHSEKRFAQRAAAMDVVFEHQGATPEHAVWLTFHMAHALPLIKAVTRVMNLQRTMREQDPCAGLTDMEANELETVRRAIYVAEKNRCRELERIRRMTRSINESVEIIKSRIRALER